MNAATAPASFESAPVSYRGMLTSFQSAESRTRNRNHSPALAQETAEQNKAGGQDRFEVKTCFSWEPLS
jgi:hypothetical protein